TEGRDVMREARSRRRFMRDGSIAAAALTGLTALKAEGEAAERAAYLCVTCGTQFPESPRPPEHCAICEDERQYVGPDGQQWTTLERLRTTHRNTIKKEEEGLYSINTEPRFGIGQRAFLIRTPGGNLLWDCVGLIDDPTVARIKELGGIAEIAISHPHYYTPLVEWRRAHPHPRGGAPLGGAARPLHPLLEGRASDAPRRPAAGPHRRPLRGLSGPALARRRRRARRPDGRGPAADLHGPEAGQLHVELPELHPAGRHGHPARPEVPGGAGIRPDLRRVLRPRQGGHSLGREASRSPVRRTLPQGDPRLRRDALAGSQSGRGQPGLPFASRPIAGTIPPGAGSCR